MSKLGLLGLGKSFEVCGSGESGFGDFGFQVWGSEVLGFGVSGLGFFSTDSKRILWGAAPVRSVSFSL